MASPAYYSLIQNGSTGPDVALVQKWLNGIRTSWPSIPALSVDGNFGSGTTRAVRTFQGLAGLSIDGKVGQNTWNALYAKYASLHGEGEQFPGINMRNGQAGATVRSAQTRLGMKGFCATADGKFGSNTETAVRNFQSAHNLSSDGVIGASTWSRLYAV